MNTKRLIGMMAAVVVAGSLGVFAEPGGAPKGPAGEGPGGGGCDSCGPMMGGGAGPRGPMGQPQGFDAGRAKMAGATEEQIAKLEAINTEQQEKRIDLQAAVEKAELKMNSLIRAKDQDEKAILQAADVLNQARGELFKLHLSSMIKEKQILGEAILRKMHETGPLSEGGHHGMAPNGPQGMSRHEHSGPTPPSDEDHPAMPGHPQS